MNAWGLISVMSMPHVTTQMVLTHAHVRMVSQEMGSLAKVMRDFVRLRNSYSLSLQ